MDEAAALLDAIGKQQEAPPAAHKDARERRPTKLRINVDSGDSPKKAKVNVNIPLSIVRSLGPVVVKNLPREAKDELDKNGIDLAALLSEIENI